VSGENFDAFGGRIESSAIFEALDNFIQPSVRLVVLGGGGGLLGCCKRRLVGIHLGR
jgi:hypothetical protein